MKKNSFVLMLTGTSLVLLIVLQVLWLQNTFEKAYFDYRRDTNNIFRTTIFTLRDSIFERNIEFISADSLIPAEIGEKRAERVIYSSGDTSRASGKIRVMLSNPAAPIPFARRDSIMEIIRPLSSTVAQLTAGPDIHGNAIRTFSIQLSSDSIPSATLRAYLDKAFKKAGFTPSFVIMHRVIDPMTENIPFAAFPGALQQPMERFNIYSDTVKTDMVRLNPMHRYSASLFNIQSSLLREISPQILFSLFLTLITGGSFIVLYRSLRAQERLMEMKNDFINNISHELKTPVATVSVAIEALRNFNGLENPRLTDEYLSIAQNELARLTLMTDKILKTTIFEKKGITLTQEVVDLELIVQQVLNSCKLLFERQGASVTFVKEGTHFVIQGNEAHLTNVVFNLLDNALKYSRINPVIIVTLRQLEGSVRLIVEDNGIGIAPEFQKKIFEKFFRVPTGDVHNAKGYGLGLSYVASVMRSHGGSIQVKSQVANGSIFTLEFPE
jgi:two-component system phosphate regulon sensor histidine kinase PhoR